MFNIDDKVTIHTGTNVFEITQVSDDMAKVWPIDERDTRDGFWIGIDQLHSFVFEMTERMAWLLRSTPVNGAPVANLNPAHIGDDASAMIGAGLIRCDGEGPGTYYVLVEGTEQLAAWDAMHGSAVA